MFKPRNIHIALPGDIGSRKRNTLAFFVYLPPLHIFGEVGE